MKKRWRVVLIGVCLAVTSACGSTGANQRSDGYEQARVDAALRHYSDLVRAMDHAGIAVLFDPEGEIVHEGQAATHGRAAIERFLSGFAGYQVLANSTEPTSTVVHGNTADQVGTYRQRVRTPEGKVVEVSGSFHAEWVRTGSGEWLIRRMGTQAAQ